MTVPTGVTIRPAVADDAPALTRLHVDVWEDAYAGLMPARVFEERRRTTSERTDRWRRMLAEGPSRTNVAEFAGGFIGFVSVGRRETTTSRSRWNCARSMYELLGGAGRWGTLS